MEQNMRFGLVLGQLAVLKKNWAVKYASFEDFLCFHAQKINFNFLKKYYIVRTKKLHRIKVRKPKKT